jgi:hypothetical protein
MKKSRHGTAQQRRRIHPPPWDPPHRPAQAYPAPWKGWTGFRWKDAVAPPLDWEDQHLRAEEQIRLTQPDLMPVEDLYPLLVARQRGTSAWADGWCVDA